MSVSTKKATAAKSNTQEATGSKTAKAKAPGKEAQDTATETAANAGAAETAPAAEETQAAKEPTKMKLVGCQTYALRGSSTSFVRGPVYTISDEALAEKLLNKRGINGRKLFKQVTVKPKRSNTRRDDATVGEAVDAMHQLDDSEENYAEDGMPDTRVLSQIIGRHVSKDVRDQAYEVFQEEEDGDGADSEQVEV